MKYIQLSGLSIVERLKSSHKGDNGRLLVIAGSSSYPGAAFLAAMAAYRTGVDNVTVIAPGKVAWAINALSPDIMTIKVDGNHFEKRHVPFVMRKIGEYDAVLIGNGMTLSTASFVQETVKRASTIRIVSLKDLQNTLLTPHFKELKIFLKNSHTSLNGFQQKLGTNVILQKGRIDIITSKDKQVFNRTGNAAMTVSGTGDVLAGICAGLVAQGNDLFTSACVAAYINGSIGNHIFKKNGYGMVASDLHKHIGVFLRKVKRQRTKPG